jgi:hypothetical protein
VKRAVCMVANTTAIAEAQIQIQIQIQIQMLLPYY